MKPRSILVVSLVVLACWLIGVIYLSGSAMGARSAALDTLTPESYLPLVYRQPTPTPTSTPSPTPIPYGVHILDNHSSFAHRDQGYSVVGQIFNNTDKYLWNVQVRAKFYNSKHEKVNTLTYTYLFTIYPRSKICFALDEGVQSISKWSYYVFQPLSYWDDGSAGPDISAHDVNGQAIGDRYYVSGRVRNDDTAPLDPLWVQATLRDKNKVVLDCRSLYDWTGPLYPDLYAAFDIEFSLRKDGYGSVRDYRLDVKADEAHR
jgi:hypothetical protein